MILGRRGMKISISDGCSYGPRSPGCTPGDALGGPERHYRLKSPLTGAGHILAPSQLGRSPPCCLSFLPPSKANHQLGIFARFDLFSMLFFGCFLHFSLFSSGVHTRPCQHGSPKDCPGGVPYQRRDKTNGSGATGIVAVDPFIFTFLLSSWPPL